MRLAYTLVMLLTVAASFLLLRRSQRSLALTRSQRWSLGVTAFIGAMLGAKLPFLREQGLEGIFSGSVWFADGKTILGGIFGGYLSIEIMKWYQGIRVSTGDSFAIPVALAVGMGRIGCFIGGCCFGIETKLPWGIHFPLSGDSEMVLRHPVQLYEATFHFAALLILWYGQRQNIFPGNRLKAYLLAYLQFRFVTEWIRPPSTTFLGLTSYQIACIFLSLLLIALWRRLTATRCHPPCVDREVRYDVGQEVEDGQAKSTFGCISP